MQNTKNEILNHCIKKTIESDINDISEFSANRLSQEMNISRSLASQYLNYFVKDGTLIKIATRPVYFLHRKTIEEQYQITIDDNIFDSVEDFVETLSEVSHIKRNFTKMIGYDASLRGLIDQIKAALKYPGNGLPIMLYGKSGVGKSRICEEMLEYAKENDLCKEGAKFCVVKVFKEQTDIVEILVGNETKSGILQQCNGGVVLIHNAHNLTISYQQEIARILEQGFFYKKNTKIKVDLKAHIVLSADEEYKKYLDEDLIQCFPVIAHVPDLEERYADEKEELIVYFFKKQALKINRKLFVSQNVIKTLMMNTYQRNIDELKNVIEDICARANVHNTGEKEIVIKMYQLPATIMRELNDEEHFNEDKIDYMDIMSYRRSDDAEKLIEVLDYVLNQLTDNENIEEKIRQCMAFLAQFSNVMTCNNYYANGQSKVLEHTISYVIHKIIDSYNMTISSHSSALFANYLYLLQSMNQKMKNWKTERICDIRQCLQLLEKEYPGVKLIADKINFALANNLEYEFDEMNQIILFLNLAYYNNSSKESKYLCIIIAHGRSTATSMAEAVNTLLGSYIFEAFDMPLDTSMVEIVDSVNRYIDRFTIKNDILLLVDMGSLETLNDHLYSFTNKNIGVINNVSTKLALDVGYQVLDGVTMETILRNAKENCEIKYTFVENKQLNDLIIFISDNGRKMANRMKDLFIKSFPKKIDVEVIALNLNELNSDKFMEEIKKEYNILLISGTCSTIEKPELFVSLEEIIMTENIDAIKNRLNQYLTIEEIDKFSQNLIYSFSLENVVDSLSILDAKKLLEFIGEAVNLMEEELNRRFFGHTTVGLYIHMSCMIERLVTKEPIKNREGIEDFKKTQKKFIEIVQKSFFKTCSHYGVELPLSEIAYLYDYIREDKKTSREVSDFEEN